MAKRKPEEAKGGAPEWMATFSDLMTLLLCFFVLLFAMSNIDTQKFTAMASALSNSPISIMDAGGADGITEMLGNGIMEMPIIQSNDVENSENVKKQNSNNEKLASDFKTYFADKAMAEQVDVIVTEEYINIVFKDGVLFDSGKAEVRADVLEALSFIGNELLKYPEHQIEIIGHTDSDPVRANSEFKNNLYLSAARAINVSEYFINVKGFSPVRISAIGRGEYLPIAPNDTPENKARNRRVEIRIRNPEQDLSLF